MTGVWRAPLLLAGLSFVGLASAILGDGVWDWLCWAGLVVPLAVCAERLWRQWPGVAAESRLTGAPASGDRGAMVHALRIASAVSKKLPLPGSGRPRAH